MSSESAGRRLRRFMVAGCVAGATLAPPLVAQERLWSVYGTMPERAFGGQLSAAGDVDGDGINDLVVGLSQDGAQGSAYVFSGANGALLKTLVGEATGQRFGELVSAAGDRNGDGFADVAVVDPSFREPFSGVGVGKLYVYSGADWSLLSTSTGAAGSTQLRGPASLIGDLTGDGVGELAVGYNWNLGFSIKGRVVVLDTSISIDGNDAGFGGVETMGLSDLDGDGLCEFAITHYGDSTYAPGAGSVQVRSGADGSLLWRIDGEAAAANIAAVAPGDYDGDGVIDFAVTGAGKLNGGFQYGELTIRSGIDGAVVRSFLGDSVTRLDHGRNAGDIDLDGLDDLAITFGDNAPPDARRVIVYSIVTGAQITTIEETQSSERFGSNVVALGDADSDGYPDVAIGAGGYDSALGNNTGAVYGFTTRLAPRVLGLTPDRARYDAAPFVTIQGRNFTAGSPVAIDFGGVPATNVVVRDDATIECDAPAVEPGTVAAVTVTTDIGSGVGAEPFHFTPALLLSGDTDLGGRLTLDYLCDPMNAIYAIAGFPPSVSLKTKPFDGTLCIDPMYLLVWVPLWPFDRFTLTVDIPNDPSLSGMTFLAQALIGPKFGGKNKDGAWTNCVSVTLN